MPLRRRWLCASRPSLAEVAAAAAPLIAASVITTARPDASVDLWVAKKQARRASLEKNA